MHIRIANLRNITQEAIGFAHSDCQTGVAKPRQPSDLHIRICQSKNQRRKPSDMHIRIANLRNLTQETMGYAHSDCQSKKTEPRNH